MCISFLNRFDADTMLNIFKYFYTTSEIAKKLPGASHADEYFYFFRYLTILSLYFTQAIKFLLTTTDNNVLFMIIFDL